MEDHEIELLQDNTMHPCGNRGWRGAGGHPNKNSPTSSETVFAVLCGQRSIIPRDDEQ